MDERNVPRTAGQLVTARSTGISIFVESHVWKKINGWCNAAKTEVSGMFMTTQVKGGFLAYEAFLPEQRCSAGYTIFDEDSYTRLKFYVISKFGADGVVDLCRGWWHTHYNFSPFWSGTDDNTAQQHMYGSDTGWAVSIVVNQKGAPRGEGRFSEESGACYKARVDILNPAKVTIDDLPVVVIPNSRKRRRKTNFAWDIDRWVKPLVQARPSFVPRYVIVNKNNLSIVNYGGKIIPSHVALGIESGNIDPDCPCGDYACIDCRAGVKNG